MKRYIVASAMAGTLLLLAISGRYMPSALQVRGRYDEGLSLDQILIFAPKHPGKAELSGAIHHEMIHQFRARALIDRDVPTAAAWGYYVEWMDGGKLFDSSKIPFFQEGSSRINPTSTIDIIMNKYKDNINENLESYEDGARLAGLIWKVFGKDDSKASRYIISLGWGFDAETSRQIESDPGVFGFIFRLRSGNYFSTMQERLNTELLKLDEESRRIALKYITGLRTTHRLQLVRQKERLGFYFAGLGKQIDKLPNWMEVEPAFTEVDYLGLEAKDDLERLSNVLKSDKTNINLFEKRGQLYDMRHEHSKAVRDYDEAIRLTARLYLRRGEARKEMRQYATAVTDLEKAVALAPDASDAETALGVTLLYAGDLDRSVSHLNQAIKLNGNNSTAYINRGLAWRKKVEYQNALNDYNEAARRNSNDSAAYFNRAWLLAACPDARFRDGDKALKDAMLALELSKLPGGVSKTISYSAIAVSYAEIGNFVSAVEWQKKALDEATEGEREVIEDMLNRYYLKRIPFRFSRGS
jgi:tetratricopeptide (TPR) repeat protein